MNITVIPIADLHLNEKNVRMHPQKQIKELVRSVKMFGQTRAIVVDEDHTILAGNGLYLAMREIGFETAECYVMCGLTPGQKTKLMLADNRCYELGMMDMDTFDQLLRELSGDTDIPGWDAELIRTLTSTAPEVDSMIDDYGVFDRAEVESINARKRDDYASPPNTASYAPVTPQPSARIPQPSPVMQPTEETAEVKRYIICPKCGEKICL